MTQPMIRIVLVTEADREFFELSDDSDDPENFNV